MALVLVLIIIISSLFLLRSLFTYLNNTWWTPITIQKMMKSQGIKGLPFTFPHGNTKVITAMRNQSMSQSMDTSHDIFPRIQPHVYSWIKTYGKIFYKNINQCYLYTRLYIFFVLSRDEFYKLAWFASTTFC